MELNTLNQNTSAMNLYSVLTSMLGTGGFGGGSNSSYAKKGEPGYSADMDSDGDGIVSFEDFRQYCKNNGVSNNDMSKMLKYRMTYQITKDLQNQPAKSNKNEDFEPAPFELIYAEENDSNYDEKFDADGDSKVTYEEYLRYCEQNARQEAKNSDTKIRENDKSKFMTVSYGRISNVYNKVAMEAPEGKVENIA